MPGAAWVVLAQLPQRITAFGVKLRFTTSVAPLVPVVSLLNVPTARSNAITLLSRWDYYVGGKVVLVVLLVDDVVVVGDVSGNPKMFLNEASVITPS